MDQYLIAYSDLTRIALLYAQKAGLDVEKTIQVVASGAAGSWSLSNYGPRMIKRNFDPGFYVEHFVKVGNCYFWYLIFCEMLYHLIFVFRTWKLLWMKLEE